MSNLSPEEIKTHTNFLLERASAAYSDIYRQELLHELLHRARSMVSSYDELPASVKSSLYFDGPIKVVFTQLTLFKDA